MIIPLYDLTRLVAAARASLAAEGIEVTSLAVYTRVTRLRGEELRAATSTAGRCQRCGRLRDAFGCQACESPQRCADPTITANVIEGEILDDSDIPED